MDTSRRIERAAWALYSRHGEPGVSVRGVARAVGLSAMALYRHYPNRDALLAALSASAFAVWEARVAAIRARTARGWLAAVADAYLAFALDDPPRFAACFELPAAGVRRFPRDFAAGRSPAVARIAAEVQRGLDRGELAGADALTIAMILWSQAHGLIKLYRDGRFDSAAAFRRTYRRCLRLVLGAFAPGGAGARRRLP